MASCSLFAVSCLQRRVAILSVNGGPVPFQNVFGMVFVLSSIQFHAVSLFSGSSGITPNNTPVKGILKKQTEDKV